MIYENVEFSDIVYDSRKADTKSAFVCLRGSLKDGHMYAKSAYDKGCRVFFCEERLPLPEDAKQFVVDNTRKKLAELSAEFFGYPAKKLTLIGITGTKGKTTVSNIIADILNKSGRKAAVIGTNGIIIDGVCTPTANTTPESYELHKAFNQMVEKGIEFCVMEVSSQAFKQNRVHGIDFDCGVFTNISPDHISENEHKDFDEYLLCKAELFEKSKVSIINNDDEFSHVIKEKASGIIITFSINDNADYKAENIHKWKGESSIGVEFECISKGKSVDMIIQTPGVFSVYNALTVTAVCNLFGLTVDDIAKFLPGCRVKGRFEIIDTLPGVTMIIDYAHNELSMRNVLQTITEYSPQRLICLFGSIGDRAQIRRTELGRIVSKYCDLCIITSDNPGYEDPLRIISDIEAGMPEDFPHISIVDRAEAVEYAVRNAEKGDVILFAGKGHEDYQLINGKKEHFSEREIIDRVCEEIKVKI